MSNQKIQGHTPLRSELGFSLIEMFTIFVIVGVGVTLAIPAYLSWMEDADLKYALTRVTNTIKLGKMAAMSRNQAVAITLQMNGSTVQLTTNLGQFDDMNMGGHVIGYKGAPTPLVVAFNSLGLVSNMTVANPITLTNRNGTTYSIQVTPSGIVTPCQKPTCP